MIGKRGGSASRIVTTATITAEKGPDGIRIRRSNLHAVVTGLTGIEPARLTEIGAIVKQECTISNAIEAAVEISYEIQMNSAHE